MRRTSRFALLFSLASTLSFAESWSGALVDAKCYDTAQQNLSHGHPGSTDTKRVLRTCSPNEKTTSFGNEKAHKLVVKEGNKSPFIVNVTGDKTQDSLTVSTISIAK